MTFKMDYEVEEELIIHPIGELDIYTISEFKDTVLKVYNENKKNILIDGSELEYIDSTGLGALIYILNEIEKDNNKIAITNIKNSIKKLFTITKLDNVFEMRS
ncbi:STAS domain-containing protein [Anaerosphaera multitolerans]|uniref:Anti-sigma factor antagonist n=1 Tax=Anaerosphaera multitolerans TaxID=2487351 RepID=A0A437SA92_9FIRM|nr:STAS domain-containing protein [Anaerosphaera multitolerans]RVU55737.1 anti-sigma factor antagonist [Anaerosphaera multitolerans]